jgi:hypothetical protein
MDFVPIIDLKREAITNGSYSHAVVLVCCRRVEEGKGEDE